MNLAMKDIGRQKLRFAATALGLGLLFTIVLAMGGIYRGMVEDAVLLVESSGADLWIVQHDTRGPFAERSVLPATVEDRARVVRGVAWARAYATTTIQRVHRGVQLRATLVGLAWPDERAPGVKLTSGRGLQLAHGELVADDALHLALGETVRLGDDDYRVVGTTHGVVSASGDGVLYLTNADSLKVAEYQPAEAIRLDREARAERIGSSAFSGTLVERAARSDGPRLPALSPPAVQAVLVGIAPGASKDEVRATIAAWPDVSVWTAEEEEALLLAGVVEKSRKQIGLFRGLLVVVSALLVTLIVYAMTTAKTREIALLKLMGARTRVVVGMVLQQALLLAILGYGLALVVASFAFPQFPRRVSVTTEDFVIAGAGVVVLACVASIAAIVRALRIAPTTILAG